MLLKTLSFWCYNEDIKEKGLIFLLITDKKELENFYAYHRIWQGIPSIERTKKGRTFISFYSGELTETFGNYELLLKSDGDLTDFGEPVAVAFNGKNSRCFDGVLWIDPLERLWFMWNTQPENKVCAVICDDPDAEELLWSDVIYIGNGVMMNRPTVLSTGEWLFPIAVWKPEFYPNMRDKTTEKSAAYAYKTADNGKTFEKLGGADVRGRSFDEHMLFEHNNGVLRMLVRTDYGIGEAFSYDRGKNWTNGKDSGLGGPCSRFHIKRLSSNRVLLINHYNFKGRNNLTALLSEDDGKTFKYSLLLDERNWISYPDAVEGADGFIYVVYDRERGYYKKSLEESYADAREILIAKFCEQDILDGEIKNEDSKLKIVASKLGKIAESDPDPYQKKILSDSELAEKLIKTEKEDIIGKIFEMYSPNCINIHKLDVKKLDSLIENFKKTDSKDAELLTKIISFIRKTPEKEVKTYPIIEKITDYIKENLTEEFSVNLLADHIGISVYYLCHLFKTVTGTTIIEYRNELRLTKAKLMLINTEKNISEIAISVGYGSAPYFSKIFQKHEKISPTEYREIHKS